MKTKKTKKTKLIPICLGYKILTHDRKSPINPLDRGNPHEEANLTRTTRNGRTLTYPINKLVTSKKFCQCLQTCCYGIHFFAITHKQEAISWAEATLRSTDTRKYILVPCFVPEQAQFARIGRGFCRTNQIVTLKPICSLQRKSAGQEIIVNYFKIDNIPLDG